MKDEQPKELHLEAVNDLECERVHSAALRLLKEEGVVFRSAEARACLKKAGAQIRGETVFVPEPLIEWALEVVPKTFQLYDRNGSPKLHVGGRSTYFGSGSDCLNILDHRTGQRREPVLKDLEELVKLCDCLANIDFLMSMVIPSDCLRRISDRVQMEFMLKYSAKPIIAVSFSFDGTKDIIEMAECVAGGEESLREKPFVLHYVQPVKALVQNEEALQKLIYTAKKGLPCLYLVSAIMGVSCPITSAGYQVMGVAGELAALVLSQSVRPGTPFVVRGGRVADMDMRTMMSTYASPENRVYSAGIAHYHGIPCFGTAGCSDSKEMDWQAAGEIGLTLLADALAGANLIHNLGYIESGVTYSAEALVLCDEIVGWIKAFKRRMLTDEESLAEKLIREVGRSSKFLTTQHTLKHCKEQWQPDIFDRNTYSTWKAQGAVPIAQRIHNKIDDLTSKHSPPPLSPDVKEALRRLSAPAERSDG